MRRERVWSGPVDDARLDPSLTMPTYAVRGPLAAWLRRSAEQLYAERGGPYRLLDVGCGERPYAPAFLPYTASYTGLDVVPNPRADLLGPVEAIPAADGVFDVVLCVQVLEHVADPARAVAELRRVTAPGGTVLLSTHGVMVYHPSPADRWRWTAVGLRDLFERAGAWERLDVEAGAGTTACLGMLVNLYLDLAAARAHVRRLAAPLVAGVNVAARAVDRRSPLLRDPLQPGALIANYHVTATTPS